MIMCLPVAAEGHSYLWLCILHAEVGQNNENIYDASHI